MARLEFEENRNRLINRYSVVLLGIRATLHLNLSCGSACINSNPSIVLDLS